MQEQVDKESASGSFFLLHLRWKGPGPKLLNLPSGQIAPQNPTGQSLELDDMVSNPIFFCNVAFSLMLPKVGSGRFSTYFCRPDPDPGRHF